MKCKICELEIPEDFKCKIPKYDERKKERYEMYLKLKAEFEND